MPYGTLNVDKIVNDNGVTFAGLYGFKNRLINGAMMIDQRNAGASVSTSAGSTTYTLDRFVVNYTQTSKFTVQQNAGSVTPPAGYTNYLGVTSSSAYSVLSTDVFYLQQRIEGYNVADLAWGTAAAATVTLSFWVRSSLTGTFGGSLNNNGVARSYPFSFTINSANTWEQKTVTVAGDQTGTWLTTNGIGMYVIWSLGAGSTYNGTANTWQAGGFVQAAGATSVVGTNGATFYITGVQLEKGSTATSFDYRPYGTELALCQRYFCKTFSIGTAPAQNAGTVGSIAFISQAVQPWDAMWRFPVQMQTAPTTVTTYSTNAASANWSTNGDTPTASVIAAGESGLGIRASTPAAAGRGYTIHASADAEL